MIKETLLAEKILNSGIYRFTVAGEKVVAQFSLTENRLWKTVAFDIQALAQTSIPKEKTSSERKAIKWLLNHGYTPLLKEGTIHFIKEEKQNGGLFYTAYQACLNKNLNALLQLSPNELKSPEGRSLLQEAIEQGETAVALWLIENDIAIDGEDEEKNTSLHYAAKVGNLEIFQKLWEKGISVSQRNIFDQTPLHIAAQFGHAKCVEALLINGASLLAKGTWVEGEKAFKNLTPLAFALMGGNEETVALFLKEIKGKAKEQLKCGSLGNILHLAIHFPRYDLIHFLFEKYGNVMHPLLEKKNKEQMTPFMLAARLGEKQLLLFLKQKGANIEAADDQENRAMHYAAIENNIPIIQCLFSLGCTLDPVNKNGETPTTLIRGETIYAKRTKGIINNLRQQENLQKAKPLSFTLEPPENFVFQGGGPKGIAYVGVVKALEEKGMLKSIKRVAGTSAGAINACVMALGYQVKETEKILFETDLKSFLDHPLTKTKIHEVLNNKFGGITSTLKTLYSLYNSITNPLSVVKKTFQTLWHTTGICEGETFRLWIEELVKTQTGIPYCTFGELKQKIESGAKGKNGMTFLHLYVYVTCLKSKETIVCVNSEEKKWKKIIISDAIRASMSIPGAFKPHFLHWKNENGNRIKREDLGSFADGGMLYNFPLEAFDKKKYQVLDPLSEEEGEYHQLNKKTLGFTLYSPAKPQLSPIPPKVETVGDLLSGLTQLYFSAEESIRKLTPYNKHRVIPISNEGVGTLEFSLTNERKKMLIHSGETGTYEFLNRCSFYERETDSLFLIPSQPNLLPSPIKAEEIVQHRFVDFHNNLKEGLNFELICQTKECLENGKKKYIGLGLGDHNVGMKLDLAVCPSCKQQEGKDITQVIFWKCHYKIKVKTTILKEFNGIASSSQEMAVLLLKGFSFKFIQATLKSI